MLGSGVQEAHYLAPGHFRGNDLYFVLYTQLNSECGSPLSSNPTLKPPEALMIFCVH